MQMRSQINVAGGSNTSLTSNQQMRGAIPYLPQFKGPATQTDRSHDPRIDDRPGAGAERTAQNWNDLPWLTQRQYRGSNADINARSFNYTWFVSLPLQITSGSPNFLPVLDTLYLLQARFYDPNRISIPPSDGFPNAYHYYGTENGPGSELVWFGFPLYIFEREQARQVVRAVMRNLGVEPVPAAMRGAYPAERSAVPRVVDGGETIDTRRARR